MGKIIDAMRRQQVMHFRANAWYTWCGIRMDHSANLNVTDVHPTKPGITLQDRAGKPKGCQKCWDAYYDSVYVSKAGGPW